MIWMIRYYDLDDWAKTAARKLVAKITKFLVASSMALTFKEKSNFLISNLHPPF